MENVEEYKGRNSILEIFRIFMLLWVIASFLVAAADVGGNFHFETFSFKTLFSQILLAGDTIGLNCFIFITGYYSIKDKWNFKKIFKLLIELFIYSVLLESILLISNNSLVGIGNFWKSFFPFFTKFNTFIPMYIIILLLTPIINIIMNKIPKHFNLVILFTLLFGYSIIPTFFNIKLYDIKIWMPIVFYLGAVVKLYDKEFKGKNFIFGTLTIIMCSILLATIMIKDAYWQYFIKEADKITILLFSSCLTMFFISLKPRYNKVINNISKCQVGIFIATTLNYGMINLLSDKIFNFNKFYNNAIYPIYVILCVIAIYVIVLLFELFVVNNLVTRLIEFISRKIKNSIENEESKLSKLNLKIKGFYSNVSNKLSLAWENGLKIKFIKALLVIIFGYLFTIILYYNAICNFNKNMFNAILLLYIAVLMVSIAYLKKEGYFSINDIIPLAFTFFVVALFNIYTYNRNFPVSEGWYTVYAQSILDGKKPYVDFELLFPPLYTYIITFFVAVFGSRIIILRIVGVLLSLFTVYVLYKIFKLFVNSYVASLCALTSFFLMNASVVSSIYYDYINFYNLFNFLGLYFIMKYLKRESEDSKFKFIDKNILLSGVFLSLALLIRQSSGLINIIFILCLLVFVTIICKSKNKLKQLISMGVGILIPVVFTGIILLCNGCLVECLYQTIIVAPSAKGGVSNALFRWIDYTFSREMLFTCITLIIAFIIFLIVGKINKNKEEVNNDFDDKAFRIFSIIFTIIFISLFMFYEVNNYINQFKTYEYAALFYMISMLLFFGYSFYNLFKYFTGKEVTKFDLSFMAVSGFAFFTQFGCCTSGGVSEGQGALTVGIIIASIYLCCRYTKFNTIYKYGLVSFSIMSCLSCFARINIQSYNWWGLCQPGFFGDKTESDSIYILDGIKIHPTDRYVLEGVVNTVKSDLNEEDEIYCFAQIPIFYSLIGKLPSITFSYVPWFDVSIQETLHNDLIKIIEEEPKYIVVAYIPEFAIAGHEEGFNGGEVSIQRSFFNYFNYVKENGKYEVAFSADLNAANGGINYPIEVLKLK